MNSEIKINDRLISPNHPPFVIAEMSGNHNQSIERAFEIIDSAAEAGAHAIKLQTYTANTITLNVDNDDFRIKDKDSLWSGENLHTLYDKAKTPWEWHKPIMKRAEEKGILCFSSPFDETAIDFLEELNVPAYKIASFENNHIPLIRKAAQTGKPLIISTGMANLGELERAVITAKESGCKDLILLKCTSTYPAEPINSNISTIPHLINLFKCQVGLSDHTLGVGVSIGAVALGASVIEKHLTLSRKDGGVDSAFSMEPQEFKSLVEETNRVWQSLGKINYGPTESEKKSLMFRRSIFASEDIESGDLFTSENIKIVRPGQGAPPHMIDKILGKKAKSQFKKGTPIKIENLF